MSAGRYQFRQVPAPLRRARLDNVALVPASLLPYKKQYQEIANRLPRGSTLILIRHTQTKHQMLAQKVAGLLREKGMRCELRLDFRCILSPT